MVRKKVLITGELGMTARILEKVLQEDYDVVWSANNRNLNWCNWKNVYGEGVELDICNQELMKHVIEDVCQPDIIIHSAGVVNTKLCEQMPEQAIKSNVEGSWDIANLANKNGCKLVYFSTTAIYDVNKYGYDNPITEDSQKSPSTLYGITKYAGELICKNVMRPDSLLIIRPCFMYGGKNDNHSSLSKAVKSAITGDIYDIYLDPMKYKDFIYVDDAVNAIKILLDGEYSGDYNISRGQPIAFKNYVDRVEKITGKKVHFKYFPKEDYLHDHIVNNTKIKKIGWSSKVILEEGIIRILEDIR